MLIKRPHKLFIYWYTDQLSALQLISPLQPPAPLTLTGWHKQTGQLSSRIKREILNKETPGVWSSMILLCLRHQTRAGRSTSGTQVQGQWAGLLYIKYSICKIHIGGGCFRFLKVLSVHAWSWTTMWLFGGINWSTTAKPFKFRVKTCFLVRIRVRLRLMINKCTLGSCPVWQKVDYFEGRDILGVEMMS